MFLKVLTATLLASLALNQAHAAENDNEYDKNIGLKVYKLSDGEIKFSALLSDVDSLENQGIDTAKNVSVIIPGWQDTGELWTEDLAENLLEQRGGIAIVVDWTHYSLNINYAQVRQRDYENVANSILKKLDYLVGGGCSISNFFVYGHSIGARMAVFIGRALKTHYKVAIPKMDLCDPAGPGFFEQDAKEKATGGSRNASDNVQVIHTSGNFGTTNAIGHQDWYMGICGLFQSAAKPLQWAISKFKGTVSDDATLSHMMCNVLYIAAFDNKFYADHCLPCFEKAEGLPADYTMGFMESRRNPSIIAKISSPTSLKYPYNGYGPILQYVCKEKNPNIFTFIFTAITTFVGEVYTRALRLFN